MVNDAVMMRMDQNAPVVIMTVKRLLNAGISKARAPADDLSIVTPTMDESIVAAPLRSTVSQFPEPIQHHAKVLFRLMVRALEAQDAKYRGHIRGNVAADASRSTDPAS